MTRSGADRGKSQGIRSGATGLMTSIVGWRQAFESAVMAGSDSVGRNGNVRTVNRNRRSLELALTGAAFGALAFGSPAMAADMPLKAPHLRPAFDWSGFYIGGHTGYGRGTASDSVPDPFPTGKALGSMFGGVQLGYNHQLKSGLLLGAEVDLSFPNFLSADDVVRSRYTAQGLLAEK